MGIKSTDIVQTSVVENKLFVEVHFIIYIENEQSQIAATERQKDRKTVEEREEQ